MNARCLASGTVIYRPFGQSGLFAQGASAHFYPPLRPRQLRCSRSTNPCGAGQCVEYGEYSVATPTPLCEGSLRCRRSTPRNTLPNKFARHVALSSASFHSVGAFSVTATAMPTHALRTASFIFRLRRKPQPQAPPVGATLHYLHSGSRPTTSFTPSRLRIRARAGRHTVLGQAHNRVPVAP